MGFECHHLDKWSFANLDLCEEQMEKGKRKALILLAGASSSGKSFASGYITRMLQQEGHKPCVLSLDMYNFGLSGIIPNKVNLNYFNNSLKNMKKIRAIIKNIIVDTPFEEKYEEPNLVKIEGALANILSKKDLKTFIKGLKEEWSKLNFDEPSVYDLEEANKDIYKLFDNKTITKKSYSKIISERVETDELINGEDYDIIVVEGIYALTKDFVNLVSTLDPIKNFIDGNPKSLFLRRILRDKKVTSAPSTFTIRNYFKFIIPSYEETILPARPTADIILNNDMTFSELRSGPTYVTRETLDIKKDANLEHFKKNSKIIYQHFEKDSYFVVPNETRKEDNILRFREISKDEGKTYEPWSLIHKGIAKLRRDQRIIRVVNLLLDENEIKDVWPNEDSCFLDFCRAGFEINRIEKKIKTRLIYKGGTFTLFEVPGKKNYLEIVDKKDDKLLKEIKSLLQ